MSEAPQAAEQRLEYILKNYPNFSHTDEALYLHAQSVMEQGDAQTSGREMLRLFCEFPGSEYAAIAKLRLQELGILDAGTTTDQIEAPPAGRSKPIARPFDTAQFFEVLDLKSRGAVVDLRLNAFDIVSAAFKLAQHQASAHP